MFEIVMTILLALDALWVSFTVEPEYKDRDDLRAQALELGQVLAPYYVEAGVTATEPDTGHISFQVFPALGATWWTHGAHSCERDVALSGTAWLNPTNVYYQTPFWRAVLAHEWAHTAQGPWCGNWNAEYTADLIGYSVLFEAGDEEALVYGLRREFIMAALALAIKNGQPRSVVLDQLQLSEKEQVYYQGASARMIVTKGAEYWLPFTKALVEDDDGLYTVASPTRKLDASGLWEWVQELR